MAVNDNLTIAEAWDEPSHRRVYEKILNCQNYKESHPANRAGRSIIASAPNAKDWKLTGQNTWRGLTALQLRGDAPSICDFYVVLRGLKHFSQRQAPFMLFAQLGQFFL